MKRIKIPRRYIEITKEKERPTAHIIDPKTRLLKGRHERGDTKQLAQIKRKGWIVGGRGRTRVIRMIKPYGGFSQGQIIARTKKIYPRQVNSVLVRKGKTGRISGVTIVKEHNRRSKKGKKHTVKKYKRLK